MSPTSYQTAPPRISIIASAASAVKPPAAEFNRWANLQAEAASFLLFELVEAASTFWQRFNAAGKFNAAAIFADAALDLVAGAIWPVNASRA